MSCICDLLFSTYKHLTLFRLLPLESTLGCWIKLVNVFFLTLSSCIFFFFGFYAGRSLLKRMMQALLYWMQVSTAWMTMSLIIVSVAFYLKLRVGCCFVDYMFLWFCFLWDFIMPYIMSFSLLAIWKMKLFPRAIYILLKEGVVSEDSNFYFILSGLKLVGLVVCCYMSNMDFFSNL